MKIISESHKFDVLCSCGKHFSVDDTIVFACCARCGAADALSDMLEDRRRQQAEADEEAEKNG